MLAAMSATQSSRWQVPRRFELHWRSWGEEYLVFHGGSGDTHLLGEMEAQILKRLQQTPAHIPELVTELGSALTTDDDDEPYFFVESVLEALEKLALVERVAR